MRNGVLNVYKEAGFTSHDVVAKLRGICGQKKIGHTGTLDPDAVGVLPVCLGNATKLCELLSDETKEYEAVLLLGKETDTQDLSGRVLWERAVTVDEKTAEEAVLSFLGPYEQIPPMYSALKVNGKKLYELARAGKEVERRPRPVRILSITILKTELPEITFRVECSKGTYIRTLCHDIGTKLGCGGVMKSLKRTRVGRFDIKDALTLGELERMAKENRLEEALLPVEELFSDCPRLVVKPECERLVQNGNEILPGQADPGQQKLTPGERVRMCGADGTFYGLYAFYKNEGESGKYRPVKMFLT
ncbi:MAG TPA: tRNA pseudouridine(55) synthase TruB [Candidatus Eisenbergiella merdipullorum]|uniref:tRNA pseudouridine synthase B n=1 Tax=Candidatus Eisenbergiella merdipullorum TaxID=2838553 RepID=A0A9D2I804_9FIRM|nr:tRNA pseudouridine(55) synthase TruB [Candidatus Eisenbergiella merdipullorum]